MKKILFLWIAVFILNTLAAQNNGAKIVVPDKKPATDTGNKSVLIDPNDRAAWKKSGRKAEYSDPGAGKGEVVTYDAEGNAVVSEDNNAYPPVIGEYYTKNYPNETFEVWSSLNGKGEKTYYISRKTEVLWFDKNGKYKTKTKVK